MKPRLNLRYNDLISPTMSHEEYLKQFKEKITNTYNNYEPKSDVLEKIENLLGEKKEELKILVLGAEWCPDCNRNVPRMTKIVKTMKNDKLEFRILYGIMKNALYKPGEVKWHKTRSPPEANDPKFNLEKLPTFYFFNKNNELIGVIEENPKKTIEEDLLDILESDF